MNKQYETERLVLKELNRDYGEQVLQYFQRNWSFLKEWDEERPDNFLTLHYQTRSLQSDFYQNMQENQLKLWIFKKEDKGFTRVIGNVTFSLIIRGILQSCVIGYKLDQMEINQGYMTEAVEKGIEIIFEEYELHRIEALIIPRNTPSIRVVEKLGFTYEGTSRKLLKVNGKWEDHMRWSMINEKI